MHGLFPLSPAVLSQARAAFDVSPRNPARSSMAADEAGHSPLTAEILTCRDPWGWTCFLPFLGNLSTVDLLMLARVQSI